MVRADLHNYLATDNKFTEEGFFNRVIDRARETLGSGGVLGVTDVSNERRYGKFVDLLGYDRVNKENAIYIPEKEITIVRGERVFTSDAGSFLVLGLKEKDRIPHELPVGIALKDAYEKEGIISINPAYTNVNEEYLEIAKVIEAHNGSQTPFANRKARKLYNGKIDELGFLVSSGGHSIEEIGTNWLTLKETVKNIRDIESSSEVRGMLLKSLLDAGNLEYETGIRC